MSCAARVGRESSLHTGASAILPRIRQGDFTRRRVLFARDIIANFSQSDNAATVDRY